MFSKKEIKNLQESVDELSEQIKLISEKQNTQFTEIMMQLKKSERVFYTQDEGDEEGTDDELYEEARKIVVTSQKASTSWIQRKLGIGYSRSAKLIDTLEEEGVIGEAVGSKSRIVLVKK